MGYTGFILSKQAIYNYNKYDCNPLVKQKITGFNFHNFTYTSITIMRIQSEYSFHNSVHRSGLFRIPSIREYSCTCTIPHTAVNGDTDTTRLRPLLEVMADI